MSLLPDPGKIVPHLDGFTEAQERKRLLLGSDIVFHWPAHVTFAPGTPVDAQGKPYDPLAASAASSSVAPSATLRCGTFFKAVNRGGAEHSEVASPLGHMERTRIFVALGSADGPVVRGLASAFAGHPFAGSGQTATSFTFHGERFKIVSIKDDNIAGNYTRTLVYGQAEAASDTSGVDL